MRGMTRIFVVAGALAALGGCQSNQNNMSDQNIAIDNTAANADIETLPADESSETPSNQLATGTDNPDVNDINASSNSY